MDTCGKPQTSITNCLELEICLAMSEKPVINLRSCGDYYNLQYFVNYSLNKHFKWKCLRIETEDHKILVLMGERLQK